jgi:transcription elongation factor GreA
MTEEILLTQEGYDKIVAEHEDLVSIKRQEIAERIKEAISYGDISENAEYDSAKNEQAELEERILKLENMLRMAKIIDERHVSDETVNLGLKVTVKEKNAKKTQEYTIVGSAEADPFEGKISNESPLGKALMGKAKGDTVEVSVPDGTIYVKVVDIKKQQEEPKGEKRGKAVKEEKEGKTKATKAVEKTKK